MAKRLCWIALLLAVGAAPALAAPTTIAVLPFLGINGGINGDSRAWLGTGIADMLMEDIAAGEQFLVLERTRLNSFIREAELAASGFSDTGEASRVGRIARLDQAVFGNYQIDGGILRIQLTVVEVAGQVVVHQDQVSGRVEDIHQLVGQLARRLFVAARVPLSAAQQAQMDFRATGSLSATEHFYRGFMHQDAGDYGVAFGEFVAASQIDRRFRRAKLWMARMLEFVGRPELAIAAYDDLGRAAANHVVGRDALLFAALLSADRDPPGAINRFRSVADLMPPSPHSLEAAFQLGRLLEQRGEPIAAHAAYQRVERLHEQFGNPSQRPRLQASQFFRWSAVLNRYRDARLRMTTTYRALLAESAAVAEPPQGVLTVAPGKPEFTERRYRDTKSLFEDGHSSNRWAESFYTIVVPPGYVATAIDLQVRGEMLQPDTHHSFTMRVFPYPMPANYHNTWLGVIYGQTSSPTSLEKHIPFYGNDQRLLTLQFVENHSRIYDWGFRLHLKPESEVAPLVSASTELANVNVGKIVSRVAFGDAAFTGVSKPLADHWYEARQRLSLVDNFNDGVHLAFARGDLAGEQTDLWWARYREGETPTAAERLACNSLSHDFSPRLVRGEDGSVRLFWISDRRGLGWELWTCARDPSDQDHAWSSPVRIPLEDFAAAQADAGSGRAEDLLHFGVTQDRRGRWLVVYRAEGDRLVVLSSPDAENWSRAGSIEGVSRVVNPAIIDDSQGRYRIAHFSTSKRLSLWSSNDLANWHEREIKVNRYRNVGTLAAHAVHLFNAADGELVVLVSDTARGLQYAKFDPDLGSEARGPSFDLVRDIGLEAYAATAHQDGFLLASQGHSAIDLKWYQEFQASRVPTNAPGRILYAEDSPAPSGDLWRRVFARTRAIQPDVTSVGVGRDGRVWWGIETGAMTLKDQALFGVDVSEGFFHHHVTTITPCGDATGFASRDNPQATVGLAFARSRGFKFVKHDLGAGRVSAVECVNGADLIAATTAGEVFEFADGTPRLIHQFPGRQITTLAAATDGALLVATSDGKLYRIAEEPIALPLPASLPGPVVAAVYDVAGRLWISVAGQGVMVRDPGGWRSVGAAEAAPYRHVSELHADADAGVWMMPGAKEHSRGVAWSNGVDTVLYNAPDRRIHAPTGMGVDKDGIVWIGTAFDGLYRLERGAVQ